ncbi:acyl-CoA dehydrogenase [Pseudomonas citronellolis]|uniref:acyl-CoA dehydrogenase n=1 Tax=Pseudomonas citronellolis TaxID=53408 RepID=UPI0023E47297|nr:acyl-CoA dehydrogenase [Pseudomonas citronellolis]MDF3937036.1 acyl-CoA dehydrogenase [Pseudomonas citronellolis]
MPWNRLLGPLDRLPADLALDDWYSELLGRAAGAAPLECAVLAGRLAATPGLAFLGGYQAALRALWPAAPAGLGALCVSEGKRLRPADLATRLDGLTLHGRKDFATAGDRAAWYLVGARDEPAGAPPRLAMTVVLAGAPGARLEPMPPMPLIPDVPHARLVLDGAHCERLPGDGWDAYSKPFRCLEDVHVMAALLAWLYGVGLDSHWPRELALRLVGLLGGCAEVLRHPVDAAETHLLLGGLFAQFDALAPALDAAIAQGPAHWAQLWQRDRAVLALGGSARAKRLDKAWAALGLDPGQ